MEVLVELPYFVEDMQMVNGDFKEVVDEVLQQQRIDVFLAVGRDLVLFVVQFAGDRSEVFILLFYLLSFPLFLGFAHHLITIKLLSNFKSKRTSPL